MKQKGEEFTTIKILSTINLHWVSNAVFCDNNEDRCRECIPHLMFTSSLPE